MKQDIGRSAITINQNILIFYKFYKVSRSINQIMTQQVLLRKKYRENCGEENKKYQRKFKRNFNSQINSEKVLSKRKDTQVII